MLTVAVVVIAVALLPLAVCVVLMSMVGAAGIAVTYGKTILRVVSTFVAGIALIVIAVGALRLVEDHRREHRAERPQRVAQWEAEERARTRRIFPNGPEMVRLLSPNGKDIYIPPEERGKYYRLGYHPPMYKD
jgi:uncharacterized membrane protein